MRTGDKRNSAAGTAGASSFFRVCSPHGEWGFNRSQLLCLTKVWPPPLPSSHYHHRHPPICLSLLPANKSCRREMCCHFSSVPSSPDLRIQLCNANILLGRRGRSNQNNYLSPVLFHRRLVFFPVNLQPEWNRLCLEGFSQNITKTAAVTQGRQKLQWHAGSTSRFITWLFQQEIHNQLPKKKKKKTGVWRKCVNQMQSPWYCHTGSYEKTSSHQELHGIYSSVDPCEEDEAATLHVVWLPLPLGIVNYFRVWKQDRCTAKLTSQCVSWPKQLKREATQRQGGSTYPWLWWDKMSSPWDIICCLRGPPHCPLFISIPFSNSHTPGHVVQNCKGLN